MKKNTKLGEVSVTLRPDIATELDSFVEAWNYDTQNPKALAEIPIHIVAEIGAKLQTADSDPVKSIRTAYALLDAAEAARQSLQASGCVNPGLGHFDEERKIQFDCTQRLAEQKIDPLYQEKDGKPSPISFEKALSSIFGKSIKKTDREKRIKIYLEENEASVKARYPKLNVPQCLPPSQQLQKWKTEGLSWFSYTLLKYTVPKWWKKKRSHTQAVKRKGKTKGEAEPKGKQGRVIRKNDKRKGSKAGSFLEALKKTS
jgi:hypothetical protein